MRYLTATEKQTFNLGKKLAKTLKGGEVLALSGDLGAGKTVLTKGLAAGLGVKGIVNSPTFVLMKLYPLQATSLPRLIQTKRGFVRGYKFTPPDPSEARIRAGLQAKKLIHIDCYRLKSSQELMDIGASEYFNQLDTIVVIEWAEKIKKILPQQVIKINIKIKAGGKREITIT
ncbi:tRNA (adenosine(37)-N6)-threonylcarbamoyltransferase complex ATPase subunit type 1 TsaE [Candidatus Falkowbacteria bacterium]|nr:tRNA (adenosine(37)-N6)-threonylcarbamoyltransferase complex ATPase subunit type 1 TsaE [Candidatus Falkowbacteria bacterium]